MRLLLLFAAMLLSTGEKRSPPAPDLSPPPPSGFPAPPPPGWPDSLPQHVPTTVLSQPDWSDSSIYPQEARDREQEGKVVAELIVGRDGIPRLCHIAASSGYAQLDSGSCQLLMQMRFAPPRDERGRPIETVVRRGLNWLLSDQVPFAPARMTARLTLGKGAVTGCGLDQEGSIPEHWPRIACGVFKRDIAYYVRDREARTALATIVIDVRPEGAPSVEPPAAPGRLVATRQTTFDLNPDGGPSNCRTDRDEGFGPEVPTDHQTPCGFFLAGAWFESAEAPPARHGTFEMRVYVQDAK